MKVQPVRKLQESEIEPLRTEIIATDPLEKPPC